MLSAPFAPAWGFTGNTRECVAVAELALCGAVPAKPTILHSKQTKAPPGKASTWGTFKKRGRCSRQKEVHYGTHYGRNHQELVL